MSDIEKYLELRSEVERCNFQIGVLNNNEGEQSEIDAIVQEKVQLTKEITPIEVSLSADNINAADRIRIGYIEVLNVYLRAFAGARRIGMYVDLHQNKIFPGYLLGMPVHDLRTVLATEGNGVPGSYLGVSKFEWDSDLLLNLLTEFRQSIINKQFGTFLEAMDFYLSFEARILEISEHFQVTR